MAKRRVIEDLTDEQMALMMPLREKWRSIQNNVEPIDREKVTQAINEAYLASNYPKPEILFYSNPFIAIHEVTKLEGYDSYLGNRINVKFGKRVFDHLRKGFQSQLSNYFCIKLSNFVLYPEPPHYPTDDNFQPCYFSHTVMPCLESQLYKDFEVMNSELEFHQISRFTECLERPAEWSSWACTFDFCVSVFQLQHDKKKWHILQQLIQSCGFLFWFENVCIACDRPSKLSFDAENLLHAEGEPALQFPDSYGVYAIHGTSPYSQS